MLIRHFINLVRDGKQSEQQLAVLWNARREELLPHINTLVDNQIIYQVAVSCGKLQFAVFLATQGADFVWADQRGEIRAMVQAQFPDRLEWFIQELRFVDTCNLAAS